jgi:outer membrane lipoprotein YfiO
MKPLSPRARLLLERHRARESHSAHEHLSKDDKKNLLLVIQQRGARGDIPSVDVPAGPPAAPPSSWVARLWAAPLGKVVIAAVVAGPVAATVALRKKSEPPTFVEAMASQPDAPKTEPSPTTGVPATAPPPMAPSASTPTNPSRSSAKTGKSSDVRASPTDPVEPTIDAEMRLLKAAQTSLGSGNAADALRILDEHASRFPSSKLTEARDVTRVTALCKLGQTAQATKEADRFLAGHPDSPFVERVKKVCSP